MPEPPDDDKTLMVPSARRAGAEARGEDELAAATVPVHAVRTPTSEDIDIDVAVDVADALDNEQTQRVPLTAAELGVALDDIEETIRPRASPEPSPASREEPTVRREPAPELIARGTPANSSLRNSPLGDSPPGNSPPRNSPPAPLASEGGATVTGQSEEHAEDGLPPAALASHTLGGHPRASSATRPATPAALAPPAPHWLAGYLVTCAVLTLIGLGVLWFEYRTLGHLLSP
jgi:hypothetical protein